MNDITSHKDFFKCFVLISLVSLLTGWLIGFACSHSDQHTKHVNDSIIIRDTFIVEKPALVKERFIPVEMKVDTEAILRNYQMERIYNDTVFVHDYGYISLIDTVYNNTLTGRDVVMDLTIPKSNRRYAFGVGGDVGKDASSLSAHFRYNRWTFTCGYSFMAKGPVCGIKYDILQW